MFVLLRTYGNIMVPSKGVLLYLFVAYSLLNVTVMFY